MQFHAGMDNAGIFLVSKKIKGIYQLATSNKMLTGNQFVTAILQYGIRLSEISILQSRAGIELNIFTFRVTNFLEKQKWKQIAS